MIDLYYAPDNASLIIRIILEELDIKYRAILVDRRRQQQQSASYLSLNPKGLIPVCIIDGKPIFETAAIALTFAENSRHYGANNTIALAVDAQDSQRPLFLKWLFFISNTLHSDLRQMFYAEKYVGKDKALQEAYRLLTRERLLQNFAILEAQYVEIGQTYLFGGDPTIIDIYLALCIRWAQLYPAASYGTIKVTELPSINNMVTQLQSRDAVISACAKDGVTGTFFSDPGYPDPAEGSAL